MKKDVLLATCFGLGKLPWASGTWASLPPVVLYQVLGYLGPQFNALMMGLFVVAGTAMYLGSATAARNSLGAHLHHQIVADKLAGQGLTMLLIAVLKPIEICNSMALGFVLFRLADVFIARLFKLRSGVASNLRNLVATLVSGVVAGILSAIAMRMMPTYFD
jgi:phosphatidylglycerophosphatase A